jgi:hypothetical protein
MLPYVCVEDTLGHRFQLFSRVTRGQARIAWNDCAPLRAPFPLTCVYVIRMASLLAHLQGRKFHLPLPLC